jgi:hypothetical protein
MIETFANQVGDLGLLVAGIVGVVVVSLAFILFYRIPRSVVIAYLIVFPIPVLYIPLGTFNIRGDDVVIVVGALALAARFGLGPIIRRAAPMRTLLLLLVVLQTYRYGSLVLAVASGSINWYETLQGVHAFLQVYVFVTVIRTEADIDWLTRWYFVIVLLALISSLPSVETNPFVDEVNRYAMKRSFGEGQTARFNPNAFGIMASIVAMMGLYHVSRHGRLRYLPGIGVAFGVLLWFFFRTPLFVTLFVAVFCLGADALGRPGRAVVALIALASLTLVASDQSFDVQLSRYMENLDPRNIGLRTEAARVGIRIFQEHWLVGVGLGQSREIVYATSGGALGTIHNSYVGSLAEHGLIGTTILAGLLLGMLRRFVEWMFDEPPGRFWVAFWVAFLIRIYFGPDLWLSKFTMQHFAIAFAAMGVFLDRKYLARAPVATPVQHASSRRRPGSWIATT